MEKNFCNKVITIPQFGSTCWFNAILMSVLYSQNSRKLLLKLSKSWDKSNKILNIFKELLYKKYIKNSNDSIYFKKISPEHILSNLYKYNNKKFSLNIFKHGYLSEMYIRKIYKLFGASVLMLDTFNNKLKYSEYNNGKGMLKNNLVYFYEKFINYDSIQKKLNANPSVIILNHYGDNETTAKYWNTPPIYYHFHNEELLSFKEEITFNGYKYTLDSVILTNWNKNDIKLGHAIAGIKCKNEKYVYNGWTRSTIDPSFINKEEGLKEIPCELMKFNWDLNKNPDFCLNVDKCILDTYNIKINKLCFNFQKPKRILIYIKQDKDYNSIDTNISNFKKIKECPDGKFLNPKTNRCNKIKIKKIKECPEGKFLNPKTNRCNLIKIKELKVCPEGKILNPLTNRCNKIKIKKIKN